MKKLSIFCFLIIVFCNSIFAKAPETKCDDHAEFYDPNKIAEGVYWNDLDAKKAIIDCKEALSLYPNELRFSYQLARGYYKDEQFEIAYNLFLQLADKKYAYAFYELGYMEYFEEYGQFSEDTVNWFIQASKFNIKNAFYYAGMSYYYLEMPHEAEKYLLISLDDERYGQSEKVDVYFDLAENYRFWDNVTPKYDEALKYYNKIINSDFNLSILNENNSLSSFVNAGFITQKRDKDKALELYRKGAQFYEQNIDEFGDIDDAKDSMSLIFYNIGTLYEQKNENMKAVNYYNKSIEIYPEVSRAYNNLSTIYEYGEDGVMQNFNKAFEIVMKGYETNDDYKNNPLVLYNIGYLYENGKGTEQSFENALKYYELGTKTSQVSLLPYEGLAYLYSNGYGVTINIEKSKEILNKAKLLYENANGNFYNFRGYDQDIIRAYDRINSRLLELEDINKGRESLDTPEFNLANNCENITSALEQGENQQDAFLQCLYLAEEGNKIAQYWMGYFYAYGYQVSQNYVTSGDWYTKASILGDDASKYELINLILNGYYSNPDINIKNYIQDLFINDFYRYDAQYFNGLIYKYGIEEKEDFELSTSFFQDVIDNSENDQLVSQSRTQLNEIISAQSGFAFDENIEEKFPREFKGTYEWEDLNTFNKFTQDWLVTFDNIKKIGPKRYQVIGVYEQDNYIVQLRGYIDSSNNTIQLWESDPKYKDNPEKKVESWITKGSYLGFYDKNYQTINSIWIPEKNTAKGYLRLENKNKLINKENVNIPNEFNLNFGKYYAVVIGNNDYETEGIEDLDSAILDAEAVANLLDSKYNFEVLPPLINATRRDILSTLNSLKKKLGPYDNLLIYYAGHGYLDDANRGYWMPVDANTIDSEDNSQWISSDDISNILTLLPAKHIIVVADSCYSGSLVIRGSSDSNNNTNINQNYFKQLLEKKTRKALTSGALQPVLDGGGQGHSVFASAFLTLLNENNIVLPADTLSSSIKKMVTNNADQTPLYKVVPKTGDEGGDFIFVPQN